MNGRNGAWSGVRCGGGFGGKFIAGANVYGDDDDKMQRRSNVTTMDTGRSGWIGGRGTGGSSKTEVGVGDELVAK